MSRQDYVRRLPRPLEPVRFWPVGFSLSLVGMFVWFPNLFMVGFIVQALIIFACSFSLARDVGGCAAELVALNRERSPLLAKAMRDGMNVGFARTMGAVLAVFSAIAIVGVGAALFASAL